jgi:hypothetical protein
MKVTIIGAGNMDAASEPVQLQVAMTFSSSRLSASVCRPHRGLEICELEFVEAEDDE